MKQEDVIFEKDDSNNYAFISDLYVIEKYRHKGISKLLFDSVFNDLKEKNFNGRIRVCALYNNEIAINAYKKYGFKSYEVIYEIKINA